MIDSANNEKYQQWWVKHGPEMAREAFQKPDNTSVDPSTAAPHQNKAQGVELDIALDLDDDDNAPDFDPNEKNNVMSSTMPQKPYLLEEAG